MDYNGLMPGLRSGMLTKITKKRSFVQNRIITDGLKLWLDAGNKISYPGSGTTWIDLSGNGNNGMLINGVGYSANNGGVFTFDGINDYVDFGNKFNIAEFFTISFYVKYQRDSGTEYPSFMIKGQRDSTNNWELMFINSTGTIYVKINNNYVIAGVIPNDSLFHNFSFVKSGATYSIYIDFYKIITRTTTDLRTTNTNFFQIGAPASGGYSRFSLNEPLIYNRALTILELFQNFNVTKSKYGL